jgi:hypothetical protein
VPSRSTRERNKLNKLSRPKSVVGLPLKDFETLGRRPLNVPPVMRMASFWLMLPIPEANPEDEPILNQAL